MTLELYDSLSRETRPLEPREPGRLGIYVCGPTVYSYIHVGNARPYVVGMLLKRHAERRGLDVRFVSNITDINEKIDAPARESGIASTELARRMTEAYIADTDRLGLGRPDSEPLASATIDEIVALIARLIERGLAYAVDGDVYFRVGAFPSYGALSGQRTEELVEEARRIEPGAGKESPLDFALWKGHKPEEDSAWDSPWGPGRPGWHIECSAMARAALGESLDVHGGGLDLIFPHHENERAQSEGATGVPFAATWLHNGMLRFSGDKMSKSLGNVERLRDALDEHGAETLLMLFDRGHYRSPLDYSEGTLAEAAAACARLREALRALRRAAAGGGNGDADEVVAAEVAATVARFDAALDNDLNTPVALAAIFDLVRGTNAATDANRLSPAAAAAAADAIADVLDVLGLRSLDPGAAAAAVPDDVRALADAREGARAARDFAEADRLRHEIAARGFTVRDRPDGPEIVPR
jgi:cysteinyl-tRNA synthetase